jgi:hypothetical protein
MLKNKIIYSLRVYLQLKDRGFEPIGTTPNPQKPELMCWIFEKTPELIMALDEIIGGTSL